MARFPSFAAATAIGLLFLGALAPASSAGSPELAAVTILNGDGSFRGNGVLIHSQWVLTAAHVVDNTAATSLSVVAGDFDLCDPNEGTEQIRAVSEIQFPIGTPYNPVTLENDIALLKLVSSVAFDSHVQAVCLPQVGEGFAGDTAEVHGWWSLTNCVTPYTLGCDRQAVQLPVMTNTAAWSYYGSMMKAGMLAIIDAENGNVAPLYRSSGAGAFVQRPGGPVLVGIKSWNSGPGSCVLTTYPSVFTRVSEYRTWIASFVPLVPCTPPPPLTAAEKASVAIYNQGTFLVNGVLVGDRTVLTMASHTLSVAVSGLDVRAGISDICPSGGDSLQVRSVVQLARHPNFVMGGDEHPYHVNNLSVITLSSPFEIGPYVEPVCLPHSDDDFAGSTVGVTGWWADGPCAYAVGCARKTIELFVIADWQTDLKYGLPLHESQIALVDNPDGIQAPLSRSPGSGAFEERSGSTVLVGLMSHSISSSPCVDATDPSVFTEVAGFVPWITSFGSPPPCPAPPPTAAERASVVINHQGEFLATGVLVAGEWVLTAAAAVDGRLAQHLEVVAGSSDSCDLESSAQVRAVDSYTWPTPDSSPCGAGYDGVTLDDNIALLHLSVPVSQSAHVGPIPMADVGDDFTGATAEVRGWWQSTPCSSPIGCEQAAVELTVVDNDTASSILAASTGVSLGPCHLATYDVPGTYRPWQRSLGSGAFVTEGGTTRLAGIKSWDLFGVTGCISSELPVLYSSIAKYRGWIEWILSAVPPQSLGGGGQPPCGSGCSTPQLIPVGGPPVVGNIDFGFEIGGTPELGLAGLFLGIGPSTNGFPWEGGIIYAPMGVSFWHWNGFVPVTATGSCSGVASFPLPLPGDPALIGKQLTPQGIFLCPAVFEMVPTNAVALTIQ